MSEGTKETILTVERVGARGDGVARHAGREVYLPFTAPGDRVFVRLGAWRNEARIGHVAEVLEPGARKDAVCPHFGECGGCALQHLADDAYRAMKEEQVRAALRHRGLEASVVEHVRMLKSGNRRRARIGLVRLGRGGAAPLAGFHARDSRRVVDLRVCAVLHPKLVAAVAPLRALATAILDPGESGAASLTLVESGIDCLIDLPEAPDLARLGALASFADRQDLARLAWRVGEQGAPMPVVEHRPVRATFAGVSVDVPSDSFLQASEDADRVLTELVLAGVGSAARVADLYAGVGTFTFALGAGALVHAVDRARASIAVLAAAAARAGLAGRVTAEARDLESRPLMADELRRFDAVVFDPPRAGAKAQARALAASRVPLVVAVSCDPATFARDAHALVEGGYRLARVVPVDQFVWSPHVELVAWFARRSIKAP